MVNQLQYVAFWPLDGKSTATPFSIYLCRETLLFNWIWKPFNSHDSSNGQLIFAVHPLYPLTNQILCQKLPSNVPTLITVCPNFALNFFTSNQNLNLLAHFFSYPTDKLCIMPNVAQDAKYCPKDAQILPKDFA